MKNVLSEGTIHAKINEKVSFFLLFCVITFSLQGQPYTWQDTYAKVLPNGDLQWNPKPFQYVAGASVRYIDFEGGDDTQTGTATTSAWKHHPWDANATGNALACTGIQTYVFKRGVVYRGTLTAKESGASGNPIRLTSDPGWGTGEASFYGSTRITGGWTQCNISSAPKIPDPTKVWYINLSSSLPWTKMVCEINGSNIKRIKLARIPNWVVSDTADPMKQWWEWTTSVNSGTSGGYRIDIKNLTQSDANYWVGGKVWSEWGGMMGSVWREEIKSYSPSGHYVQTNSNYGIAKDRYYIENLPQLLDTTNEYYFDKNGSFPGRLYIRLDGEKNPNTAIIEVSTLESPIIQLSNQHDIVISGLYFGCNTSDAARAPDYQPSQASAIYLDGSSYNIEISNCQFRYLNSAISSSSYTSGIYITDNEMKWIDDQAISFGPYASPQKNVYILRNYLHDISGRSTGQWYSALRSISGYFQQAEIAGNILEMCWGSGLFLSWGKPSGSSTTVPYIRGMVHHNKVNYSQLGICDYGAIASWQGGPAYYFNNISKNARGYKKSRKLTWGPAFYLDGAFKQYNFNNIAIGYGNNLNDPSQASNPPYEQVFGFCNTIANNTAYKFYQFSNTDHSRGYNFYLGNICSEMSKNYYGHDTPADSLPFDSYGNNMYYCAAIKPWMGTYTSGSDKYSLEDFRKGLQDNHAQLSQLGWNAINPIMTNPEAGDFRPVPGGEAIDRGIKIFVPYSLYAVVGEWNFYKHPADSTVIMGENFYFTSDYTIRDNYHKVSRNDLTAYNVKDDSYIKGNLEDWTEGALDFNGTGTYCSIADSKLKAYTCTNLDMTTNNFIIEVYFRTIKNSISKSLVSKYSGTGNGYILDINSTGNARMRLLVGGADANTLSGSAAVNDGNWHHVLAEVNRAGSMNMYVDGILSNGTATGAMPDIGTSLSNSADFNVGRDNSGNYLAGTFDFLRVSKGTLADAATTYGELYAWEFDGPFLKDFAGKKPQGVRDVGAIDNGKLDGEGLKAEYYDNQNFTNLVKTVIDPNINFSWDSNPPDALMGTDHYSVRWTGQVLPKYNEEYTFEIEHADGVRLWVNGRLLIDNWADGNTTQSETIKLLANQKYDIKLEYYKNTTSSKVIIRWQSASQAKEVIPTTHLFPPCILSVSASNLDFGYDTSAASISIQNAKTAAVTTDKKWLKASINNTIVTVSVSKNISKYDRIGKVTVAGCQSKIITVMQAGNPNADIKPHQVNPLDMYPNPALNQLTVETPDIDMKQDVYLAIHDMQGRLLIKQLLVSGSTRIDVSALQAGIYIIKIDSAEALFADTFIKY